MSIFTSKPYSWGGGKNELEWAFYYAWFYFSGFQNYLAFILNFLQFTGYFHFYLKKAKH